MAEGSISSAIKLYEFNIKISESFYSSLHNVEIFLRNNFHSAMMEIYGEKWFLNRNLLAGTSGREFVNIVKVDDIIAKLKTSNTSDVISNLSIWILGFFTISKLRNKYLATSFKKNFSK